LAGRHYPPRPGAAAPDLAFVLCHGFTGSSSRPAVLRLAGRLARYGGVVAVDFRGHGGSGGRSTVGDAEVLDVDAAVRWARLAGYARCAAVGFSMGGSVVLRHAAGAAAGAGLRPVERVDAVVSVSAPSRWYIRDTVPMRRVHWLLETALGRLTSATLLHTRLDGRWATVPEAPVEAVHRIPPTPLLVVHGDRDAYFPVEHAIALAAAAGPAAELWLEPGFGHAEAATTPALADRIAAWVLSRLGPPDPARDPAGAGGEPGGLGGAPAARAGETARGGPPRAGVAGPPGAGDLSPGRQSGAEASGTIPP
jgi:pimeloyl-ACP methyl ester carboxylesterase